MFPYLAYYIVITVTFVNISKRLKKPRSDNDKEFATCK